MVTHGTSMSRGWVAFGSSVAIALASVSLVTNNVSAQDMEVIDIKLPIPAFMGTPVDIELNEHIEKPSDTPRPPFKAPKGTTLLSGGKKVTLSDASPINGGAELVTDGNKEAGDEYILEMHRRTQWAQIDLEKPAKIYAVVVWHAHDSPQIVRDVIVQVADDADFTENVTTLYNSDYDNSSGLGVGKDKEYFENYEGRLVEGKGAQGRFVRLYSRGSTYTALNRYTEVEVFGIAQ